VINRNAIWYPNGIMEYFDYEQEKYSSFADFYRWVFPEIPIPVIPTTFKQDPEKYSITSPQGWIFYKNSDLIVTPTGDLIFGKDQVWFLDLFRKSKNCMETEFFDKKGILQEWINLENGARW
jgi:hypothetical protein